MKRKIYDTLAQWKSNPDRMPLVIKGCRQCGKTYAVQEFAKENYQNIVYINFFENPDYTSIFENSLKIDDILMFTSALIPGSRFVAGKTCIILDEIQECPRARAALKFFKLGVNRKSLCLDMKG